MVKLCPGCNEELIKLALLEDGKYRDIWSHPAKNPMKPCIYHDDGLKVTPEVIDELSFVKFQELVSTQPDIPATNELIVHEKEDSAPLNAPLNSDISRLNERLIRSEISLSLYDEILLRVRGVASKKPQEEVSKER